MQKAARVLNSSKCHGFVNPVNLGFSQNHAWLSIPIWVWFGCYLNDTQTAANQWSRTKRIASEH